MKTVFSYALPYKWPIVIALFLMLLELSVELIQPLLIAKIIDDGIMAGDEAVIWTWGSVMMGTGVCGFIFRGHQFILRCTCGTKFWI